MSENGEHVVPVNINPFPTLLAQSFALDNMAHDGSQYLQQNSRDFFAFTADAKVEVPTTTTTTTKPKKK